MSKSISMRYLRSSVAALAVLAASYLAAAPAFAAGEAVDIPRQEWTFNGVTGYFDRAQLRRGYEVYQSICAACHGMRQLYYRNLSQPGGPEFSDARVREIASRAQVTDGPNDDGEMFTRPGVPADKFVLPYPNDKVAALANGGAVPPDLSNMTKARAIAGTQPWYLEPFYWLYDIATGYQEQGADYTYALLTSYVDTPPEGVEVPPGLYYNEAYPGKLIAMPNPLFDGMIPYEDGTAETLENYSKDVTAFMMWTAEPTLEERKKMGLTVMVYLTIFAVLLYLSKQALWRRLKQ